MAGLAIGLSVLSGPQEEPPRLAAGTWGLYQAPPAGFKASILGRVLILSVGEYMFDSKQVRRPPAWKW